MEKKESKNSARSVHINARIPRLAWEAVESEYRDVCDKVPKHGKKIRRAEAIGAALLCFAEHHAGELSDWLGRLDDLAAGRRPPPRAAVEKKAVKGLSDIAQDDRPSESTNASSKKRATS